MGFVRDNRYVLFGIPSTTILTIVFVGIYFSLGTSKSTEIVPGSPNKDWNNRDIVIYEKQLSK